MSEWLQKSLAELAHGLRQGRVTAQQVLCAAVANHAGSSESLDAYVTWDPKAANQQARAADAAIAADIETGPLLGIPVSIKDLFGIRNYPTFAGTPRKLPLEWCREGPVVQELRRQHCVITGKTHMVEFAFGGLGANPHWKTPRNPWDAQEFRVPGGSSSGAGVSLCTGSALLAFGTDTAGSVRIPASMTGTVGIKTSFGRWSTEGLVPLSPSLDSVGCLSRTVEDAAYAFDALDSRLARDAVRDDFLPDIQRLRIGISDGLLWSDCSPGIAECVFSALDELAAAGARRMAIALPEAEQVFTAFKKGGLAAVELDTFLKNRLPEWIPGLDPRILERIEDAATLTAREYLERVDLFRQLGARVGERLREVDILASPTVAVTPPTIGEIEDLKRYREINLLSLRNTSIVNCLNLCALTLPVGLDAQGMPVGMQLIAPRGRDAQLLAVGRVVEDCLGSGRARLGEPPLLERG